MTLIESGGTLPRLATNQGYPTEIRCTSAFRYAVWLWGTRVSLENVPWVSEKFPNGNFSSLTELSEAEFEHELTLRAIDSARNAHVFFMLSPFCLCVCAAYCPITTQLAQLAKVVELCGCLWAPPHHTAASHAFCHPQNVKETGYFKPPSMNTFITVHVELTYSANLFWKATSRYQMQSLMGSVFERKLWRILRGLCHTVPVHSVERKQSTPNVARDTRGYRSSVLRTHCHRHEQERHKVANQRRDNLTISCAGLERGRLARECALAPKTTWRISCASPSVYWSGNFNGYYTIIIVVRVSHLKLALFMSWSKWNRKQKLLRNFQRTRIISLKES